MDNAPLETAVTEQVTVPEPVDKFERLTDRELLVHLNRRVEHFEGLFSQMGAAAEKNPMLKMMFGKMLG